MGLAQNCINAGVHQGGKHQRAHAIILSNVIDFLPCGNGFNLAVNKRQAHLLKTHALKLRQHRMAQGFGGNAGTIRHKHHAAFKKGFVLAHNTMGKTTIVTALRAKRLGFEVGLLLLAVGCWLLVVGCWVILAPWLSFVVLRCPCQERAIHWQAVLRT